MLPCIHNYYFSNPWWEGGSLKIEIIQNCYYYLGYLLFDLYSICKIEVK